MLATVKKRLAALKLGEIGVVYGQLIDLKLYLVAGDHFEIAVAEAQEPVMRRYARMRPAPGQFHAETLFRPGGAAFQRRRSDATAS